MNGGRVLVISHNSFSASKNNGKTLGALFGGWPSARLAQLYFYPEEPDWAVCKQFFRITDIEIFNKFFFRSTKRGAPVLNAEPPRSVNSPIRRFFKGESQKASDTLFVLRDILWALVGWESQELEKWLNDFAPTDIFFVPGQSCFSYRIAIAIAMSRKIPLHLYFTDDYIIEHDKLLPQSLIKYLAVRYYMRRALRMIGIKFAISELMADIYGDKFGCKFHVLRYTPALGRASNSDRGGAPFRMVYAGNLGLSRWKAICEVADAVAAILGPGSTGALEVYSAVGVPQRVIREFRKRPAIHFGGILSPDDLGRRMNAASCLLHVESFDRSARRLTRFSLSTKIPQYLALGKCILAYGPAEVASMHLLAGQDLGLVVTNPDVIEESVRRVIHDEATRRKYAIRAREFAAAQLLKPKMWDIIAADSEPS